MHHPLPHPTGPRHLTGHELRTITGENGIRGQSDVLARLSIPFRVRRGAGNMALGIDADYGGAVRVLGTDDWTDPRVESFRATGLAA